MINYVNSEEKYVKNYVLYEKVHEHGALMVNILYHDAECKNPVHLEELKEMVFSRPMILSSLIDGEVSTVHSFGDVEFTIDADSGISYGAADWIAITSDGFAPVSTMTVEFLDVPVPTPGPDPNSDSGSGATPS